MAECEGECPCDGRTMPPTQEPVFEEEEVTEESEVTEGSADVPTADIEVPQIQGGSLAHEAPQIQGGSLEPVARRKMNALSTGGRNKYFLVKV